MRLTALLLLTLTASLAAHEPPASSETSPRDALAEFNDLIGGWRGVGLPQRGSARGAWKETADWAWAFDNKQPSLVYSIADGKHLKSARLTYDPASHTYRLAATYADDTQRNFTGTLDQEQKRLELTSAADNDGEVHRLTLTRLNEKRTLVLLERQIAADKFFRIAEVGYTREGTRLAVPGADGPECVVTGGRGTTPVQYKGKTYYVCCTGCRQAFEDDPAGIIAEYEQKKAAAK